MEATSSFNADDLVYWRGGFEEPSLEDLESSIEAATKPENVASGSKDVLPDAAPRYPSMYVSLCEDMIRTVLDGESFLFTDLELKFLDTICVLPYASKFLLFRLLFRKADQWFRLEKLNYTKELGSVEAVEKALIGLCEACSPNTDASLEDSPHHIEQNNLDPDVIDLTLDDDEVIDIDEDEPEFMRSYVAPSLCSPCQRDTKRYSTSAETTKEDPDDLSLFVQDERHATLEDLVGCLTVDELKIVAKTLKLPNMNTKRDTIVQALLSNSSTQSTLSGFFKSRPRLSLSSRPRISLSKSKESEESKRLRKPISPPQSGVLRDIVMQSLKRCIRLSSYIYTIFKRLHIIFFRATLIPEAILTPAVLVRCRKRHYSSYVYERTPTIFQSRETYLAYEKALELDAEIAALGDAYDQQLLAREKSQSKPAFRRATKTPADNKENADIHAPAVEDEEESKVVSAPAQRRMHVANATLEIFYRIYPRWKELVSLLAEDDAREKGLERFEEAWVLTRIAFRGAEALADLKRFKEEADLLEELLAQKRWWRGRRGKWYERLALVLMTHMGKKSEGETKPTKRECQRKALRIVTQGLEDKDTHIVFRRMLEARRYRLEKALKVPEDKQHFFEDVLYTANKVYVKGVRVRCPTKNLPPEKPPPKPVNILPFTPIKPRLNSTEPSTSRKQEAVKTPMYGKSVWLGRDNQEVNVETLALQHYEEKGYRGFHSEGRIVHMLFGLLFWDIIFVCIPGAFETPYQSAPLDIADCFYQSREAEIEVRLADILEGRGPDILADVFDAHQPKQTWCIGVRWDTYEKEDLMEIVQCLGGQGLSQICRLLCEDYVGRSSGVPDLLVWNGGTGQCRFVEVKGPGDRLSKNQEIWIDVLIRAGIAVDLCLVGDSAEYIQIEYAPRRRRRAYRKSAHVIQIEPESEEEAEEVEDDEALDIDDEIAILPSDPSVERSAKRRKSSPITVIDIS